MSNTRLNFAGNLENESDNDSSSLWELSSEESEREVVTPATERNEAVEVIYAIEPPVFEGDRVNTDETEVTEILIAPDETFVVIPTSTTERDGTDLLQSRSDNADALMDATYTSLHMSRDGESASQAPAEVIYDTGYVHVAPLNTLEEEIANQQEAALMDALSAMPVTPVTPASTRTGLESMELREPEVVVVLIPNIEANKIDSISAGHLNMLGDIQLENNNKKCCFATLFHRHDGVTKAATMLSNYNAIQDNGVAKQPEEIWYDYATILLHIKNHRCSLYKEGLADFQKVFGKDETPFEYVNRENRKLQQQR